MAAEGETYRRAFPEYDRPYISYGIPFTNSAAHHAAQTFNASRIYIIASGSLSRNTNYLEDLKAALGERVAGVRKGMTSHTRWGECLEIVNEAIPLKVDLIMTLGAGSLTDAAKIIALAIANNALTLDDLARMSTHGTPAPERLEKLKHPTIPVVCIPTSLSGGEYQDMGGGTDDRTLQKIPFTPPCRGPLLNILDPQLTTTTPPRWWISSGFRAVDHCVEAMCNIDRATPESDAVAAEGLKLLVPGLLKSKEEGEAGRNGSEEDLKARLECMMGVIKAMQAVKKGVPMGGSHAIGHQLGPLGVGHGETSCILLPAVCKFNESVNKEKQDMVKGVLRGEAQVRKVLDAAGLGENADLGDTLDAVLKELGMPRNLKQFGVGEDKLDGLARHSLEDRWSATNPVPLVKKEQVMEVLQMVVG